MSENTPDNTMPLLCGKCSHRWTERIPLPMPASDFVKTLRRLHCPECQAASKSVLIAGRRND